MERQRILWLLIDGLGDVAAPEKTPLEQARTPFLDTCAGLNGLMDPVEPGLACGSDTAHLSLFGYDPRQCYRGRGAFETLGAGMPMLPGDIAFKSNFATMRSDGVVTSRRADRNFEREGPILCAALDGLIIPGYPEYEVAVKYATEHRCAVRVRGPNLSDQISGTDPLKDNLPLRKCAPLKDGDEAASHTSEIINALSGEMSRILSGHEINRQRQVQNKSIANVVLLRGCAMHLALPPVTHRPLFSVTPWRGFCVAPTCIIAGFAQTIGLDWFRVDGATGDYHTDLDKKFSKSIELLTGGDYDFGFVHVKAVDDAGHDGWLSGKIDWIQRIDTAFGKALKVLSEQTALTHDNVWIVVTGDHSTPVMRKDHSMEPVPFLVASLNNIAVESGWRAQSDSDLDPCDEVQVFGETEAARGALGRFCGNQILTILQHLLSTNA